MTSEVRIETAGETNVGRRREHNEDAFAVFTPNDPPGRVVCVVADGMGGHQAGEVASERAVEVVERELRAGPGSDPGELLRALLEKANRTIWIEAQEDFDKHGMGSTVVCAVLDGARAYLANVGDSPAFLISGGTIRKCTNDHAWVAEQVAAGGLTEEEAEQHPYRHILTRVLGNEETVQVDVYEPLDLAPGDALVLCSDGLTEHVRPNEITEIVTGSLTPAVAVQRLIGLANERGGHDNITVVVARRPE